MCHLEYLHWYDIHLVQEQLVITSSEHLVNFNSVWIHHVTKRSSLQLLSSRLAAFITVAQSFQNNEFYSTKRYNILQTDFCFTKHVQDWDHRMTSHGYFSIFLSYNHYDYISVIIIIVWYTSPNTSSLGWLTKAGGE